jgi:hypothetical protein
MARMKKEVDGNLFSMILILSMAAGSMISQSFNPFDAVLLVSLIGLSVLGSAIASQIFPQRKE